MIPDNRLATIIFTAIASGTLFVALASSSEKTNFKAGFDCNKAESKIERLICSDENLACEDMQLNLSYQNLLLSLTKSDANELKSNQASWLKSRDKYCSESDSIVDCIQDAYQRRNELLSEWNLAAEHNFFKRVYWIDKNPSLIPLNVIPEEPNRSLERYRIVDDFNNDGIEDLALSYEINMFGNAGGHFSLYLGKPGGGSRAVGYFFAHPSAINLQKSKRGEGIITTYARSNAGSGYLIEERITSAGIFMVHKKIIQPGDAGVPEDQKLYGDLFGTAGMKAEISETKDNSVKWSPLN